MSIASAALQTVETAAAAAGSKIINKAGEKTALQVATKHGEVVNPNTINAAEDSFTASASTANAAGNAAEQAAEPLLVTPGWLTRKMGAGKSTTHFKTIEHVEPSSLKVLASNEKTVEILGPEGAHFIFTKTDDGVTKLTTQYPDGFKLKARGDMVVKETDIPPNITSLLEEKGFLPKATAGELPAAPVPNTAAAADNTATTPPKGGEAPPETPAPELNVAHKAEPAPLAQTG